MTPFNGSGSTVTMEYDDTDTYFNIDRAAKECPPNQHFRELVHNSVQAGATEVQIVPSAAPFTDSGAKLVITDNGPGLAATIGDYFGKIGKGERDGSGNFHVGSRVSTLLWNSLGVVIATWSDGFPEGRFMRLWVDHDSRKIRWDSPLGNPALGEVGAVPDDWKFLKSPIIDKAGHGTSIMLLGDSVEDITFGLAARDRHGNMTVSPGIQRELNGMLAVKFFDLPSSVSLRCVWADEKRLRAMCVVPNTDVKKMGTVLRPIIPLGQLLDGTGYRSQDGKSFIEKFVSVTGSAEVKVGNKLLAYVHYVVAGEDVKGHVDNSKHLVPWGCYGEMYEGEVYRLRYMVDRDKTLNPMNDLAKYGFLGAAAKRVILLVEPLEAGVFPHRSRGFLEIHGERIGHTKIANAFCENFPEELAFLIPKDEVREKEYEQDVADMERYAPFRELMFTVPVYDPKGVHTAVPVRGDGTGTQNGSTPPKTSTPTPRGAHNGGVHKNRQGSCGGGATVNGHPTTVRMVPQKQLQVPSVYWSRAEDDADVMNPESRNYGKVAVILESYGTYSIVLNRNHTGLKATVEKAIEVERPRMKAPQRKALMIRVLNQLRSDIAAWVYDSMYRVRSPQLGEWFSDGSEEAIREASEQIIENERVLSSRILDPTMMRYLVNAVDSPKYRRENDNATVENNDDGE